MRAPSPWLCWQSALRSPLFQHPKESGINLFAKGRYGQKTILTWVKNHLKEVLNVDQPRYRSCSKDQRYFFGMLFAIVFLCL